MIPKPRFDQTHRFFVVIWCFSAKRSIGLHCLGELTPFLITERDHNTKTIEPILLLFFKLKTYTLFKLFPYPLKKTIFLKALLCVKNKIRNRLFFKEISAILLIFNFFVSKCLKLLEILFNFTILMKIYSKQLR